MSNDIIPISNNNEITETDNKLEYALDIVSRSDSGYTSEADDKMAQYLSFRACFFSPKESARMASVTKPQLQSWRENNEVFRLADVDLAKEFQNTYHAEVLKINYVRNLRLVIQKDMEILTKAIDTQAELTSTEMDYLKKLRASYAPDQLARMSSRMSGNGQQPSNFAQFVLSIHQNKGGGYETNILEFDNSNGGNNSSSHH